MDLANQDVRPVGVRGRGPGEYRMVTDLVWSNSNEVVAAHDPRQGVLLEWRPFEGDAPHTQRLPRPMMLSMLLGIQRDFLLVLSPSPPGSGGQAVVELLAPATMTGDTVLFTNGSEVIQVTHGDSNERVTTGMEAPFSSHDHVQGLSGGGLILASAPERVVRRVNRAGVTEAAYPLPAVSRRISSEELEEARAALPHEFALDELEWPDMYPLVSNLVIGSNNLVLVSLSAEPDRAEHILLDEFLNPILRFSTRSSERVLALSRPFAVMS